MTTVNERRFYVYAYLRTDGTPYYIGRGQRHRMHNVKQHVVAVPPRDRRVKLLEQLTHEEANDAEIFFIALYGRKDIGTGCLRNLTDGGNEGNTGWVPSSEYRLRKAAAMRDWHAANPNANGSKISAAKLGHKHADATKQRIAEALADEDAAIAAGLSVTQWLLLPDAQRRRVQRQIQAGKEPCTDATLREIKACEAHGLEIGQWRMLSELQRKHIRRTKERALAAGVAYFTWIQLSKSEQIKIALAA